MFRAIDHWGKQKALYGAEEIIMNQILRRASIGTYFMRNEKSKMNVAYTQQSRKTGRNNLAGFWNKQYLPKTGES